MKSPKTIALFFFFIHMGFTEDAFLKSDPKPPKVHDLSSFEKLIPESKPYARVKHTRNAKTRSSEAISENWLSFLGPRMDGSSLENELLLTWSNDGPKKLWELNTGTGYASPAIKGQRLVYQHRINNEVIIECLNTENGEKYWDFKYPSRYKDRFNYQDGPRSSPVISEDGWVYTYGAEGELHCLNLLHGKLKWKRQIHKEFPVRNGFFGVGTSPLIHGDALYLNIGAQKGPNVIKLNRHTGKLIWGTDRQWGASYSTPVIAKLHGKEKLLVFAGGESDPPYGGLMCIDPDSGKIHTRIPWRSKSYESVNVANPVVINNQVFISASYKTGGALIDIQKDYSGKIRWVNKDLGTHFNTAIYHKGQLYGFDGRHTYNARLACLDLETGKTLWKAKPKWKETFMLNGRPKTINAGTLRGSMIKVQDKFIALGEFGHLLSLEMNKNEYKIISKAWLFPGKDTWSSPVLSHGLLYISQHNHGYGDDSVPRLICYSLRK